MELPNVQSERINMLNRSQRVSCTLTGILKNQSIIEFSKTNPDKMQFKLNDLHETTRAVLKAIPIFKRSMIWWMWATPKNNGVINTECIALKLCIINGIIQARKTNSSLNGAIIWLRIQRTSVKQHPVVHSLSGKKRKSFKYHVLQWGGRKVSSNHFQRSLIMNSCTLGHKSVPGTGEKWAEPE